MDLSSFELRMEGFLNSNNVVEAFFRFDYELGGQYN